MKRGNQANGPKATSSKTSKAAPECPIPPMFRVPPETDAKLIDNINCPIYAANLERFWDFHSITVDKHQKDARKYNVDANKYMDNLKAASNNPAALAALGVREFQIFGSFRGRLGCEKIDITKNIFQTDSLIIRRFFDVNIDKKTYISCSSENQGRIEIHQKENENESSFKIDKAVYNYQGLVFGLTYFDFLIFDDSPNDYTIANGYRIKLELNYYDVDGVKAYCSESKCSPTGQSKGVKVKVRGTKDGMYKHMMFLFPKAKLLDINCYVFGEGEDNTESFLYVDVPFATPFKPHEPQVLLPGEAVKK